MAPLLLLLLLTLFSLLLHSTSSTSLHSDALALSSLAAALPRNWTISHPSSVCSWTGVRCDQHRTQVISIDLSNANLSLSTSIEISDLRSLVNLSLSGNDFGGKITLSNLPSLRYLNISMNQFNGGVEWDYSTLPSLQVFDAYDNNFTSSLPLSIAESKSIRYLDLGGSFFDGAIPPTYGKLSTLEYLSLNGNDLRGRIPSEFGNLTSLKQLYLGYFNVFEGGIPKELGKLTNLVHLDLSSCGLHGEIPSEIGNLAKLDTLYLHSNLLSGPIPGSLGNLSGLIFLDLSNNALTGEIPNELVGLTELVLVNLFLNRLHGSVPEFFADLPNLETLELFYNNFTGVIPQNLGSNGKIRVLDLSSNKLTGTIPETLCSSHQLEIVILLKNFLFGPIPERLGKCLSLVRVRLGQNYLNGTIPSGLLYLPQLNLLELQNNYLSGSISENSNVTQTSELSQLNLSNNQLSGPLPTSILNLTSLQTLLVSENRLEGSIPSSIGRLGRVVKLDLSRNSFSGTVPSDIGSCSELTYLDLSQNNLIGEIPAEIARIGVLNYLNLSRNHLNQSIPRSISLMKSLTSADFSFNELSGRLPDIGQFAYFNMSSFAGNPRLCGPVLNNPCNYSTLDPPGPASGASKLAFALTLLACSLVFAAAGVVKARSWQCGPHGGSSWRLTVFQKVTFGVSDVTGCMKDSNAIGRGGAGVVYRCTTSQGENIAVKRLLGMGSNGGHDHGFEAEIQTLGSIRHRNIVRLLAVCSTKEANVLVYEYMDNGSLGELLHGKGGGFLGWDRRYRIAIEAARGLCYLHHDCSPMIVHRDVKSNNILLDDKFEAHVADFGLAKFLQDGGGSECMSAIAGSYGYIAPEYAYTLKVDEKSDVYSFGVVLLELITGRRPVGDFGDGVDIVQWSKRITGGSKRNVDVILDTRLSTVPMTEAMHVFFVALLCIQESNVERPTMREVVQMLLEFPRHANDHDQSPSCSAPNQKASRANIETNCYELLPERLTQR